jgi:hypothetical protein
MATDRETRPEACRHERPKAAYQKPVVTIAPPSAQPEVLGGASHVGCDVDANCPGQDEAG